MTYVPVTLAGCSAAGASPYLLPDGNVQVAFSGGRTSELRRFMDQQGDWIFTDEAMAAGVLCQADGGECTE